MAEGCEDAMALWREVRARGYAHGLTKTGQFDPDSKKVDAYWTPRVKAASAAN